MSGFPSGLAGGTGGGEAGANRSSKGDAADCVEPLEIEARISYGSMNTQSPDCSGCGRPFTSWLSGELMKTPLVLVSSM